MWGDWIFIAITALILSVVISLLSRSKKNKLKCELHKWETSNGIMRCKVCNMVPSVGDGPGDPPQPRF